MNNVASGVYTLDLEGMVTYVNPAAENMFGWTNAELVGHRMHDVIHYKHPDGTPFSSSACPVLQSLKGIELREHADTFIRKDGSFFPVVFSASPLKKDGTTVGIVVGFRDDTQRREAERAVRESEERFRLVANTAPVMIWMSGVDKRCTYLNQGWLDFGARSLDQELANSRADGVHPEDLARWRETYTAAFESREPFQMEYRLLRCDGQYRWILDHGVPMFTTGGVFAGYIGACLDVTERKRAEEALSKVSQKLIQAQEEERSRLARELHDDVNQRVALLALTLQDLSRGLSPSTELHRQIGDVYQQLADLENEIRAMSHRFHSPRLEILGLTKTADAFCKELAGRHGVQIDFHADNIPQKMPEEISLCLFRILQEALHNAIKHSGERYFQVWLRSRPGEIELVVQDFGRGFELNDAINGDGLGLTGMWERLKLVDGQLSVDSKTSHGATIRARIPLPAVLIEAGI
jgi:PAS domain S-box-containing protein